ncbi:hypothetical protein KSW81_001158 [Nannochloris sp. 'desiccata']|nr:hypothetical protein KSW81_001158 [Chlorella desiccata (nom. nud.)]
MAVWPDCDDPELFEKPVDKVDTSYVCDAIQFNSLGGGSPYTYKCQEFVRFAGQEWTLRAIITNPACPDSGSIWTECSSSTPMCQPRMGAEASPVDGGFQVAYGQHLRPAKAYDIMMKPALESNCSCCM